MRERERKREERERYKVRNRERDGERRREREPTQYMLQTVRRTERRKVVVNYRAALLRKILLL